VILALSRVYFSHSRNLPITGLLGEVFKSLIPFHILTSPLIYSAIRGAYSSHIIVSIHVAVSNKATNDTQADNSSFNP
jgi:hypothetical protein